MQFACAFALIRKKARSVQKIKRQLLTAFYLAFCLHKLPRRMASLPLSFMSLDTFFWGILFAPDNGAGTQDKLSRSLQDLKDKVLDRARQEIENLSGKGSELAEKAKDMFVSAKGRGTRKIIFYTRRAQA